MENPPSSLSAIGLFILIPFLNCRRKYIHSNSSSSSTLRHISIAAPTELYTYIHRTLVKNTYALAEQCMHTA